MFKEYLTIDAKDAKALKAYFKDDKKEVYFTKAIDKLMSGKKFVWNWAAFSSFGFWLVFRKCYFAAITLSVFEVFFLYITQLLLPDPEMLVINILNGAPYAVGCVIINLGMPLLLFFSYGLLSTPYYLKHLSKEIRAGYTLPAEKTDRSGVFINLILDITLCPLGVLYLFNKYRNLLRIRGGDPLSKSVKFFLCIGVIFAFLISYHLRIGVLYEFYHLSRQNDVVAQNPTDEASSPEDTN